VSEDKKAKARAKAKKAKARAFKYEFDKLSSQMFYESGMEIRNRKYYIDQEIEKARKRNGR